MCLGGSCFLLALFVVGRATSPPASPTEPYTVTFSTPLGSVQATAYNARGTQTVVGVHGMNPGLVLEWSVVAQHLAAAGYRVLLPNLHSNARTSPHEISREDFASVMLALLRAYDVERVLLMGKSWGGGNAAAFAASHTDRIAKLVLDAPAFDLVSVPETCKALNAGGVPLQLLWAEDDNVVPYTRALSWKKLCTNAQLHGVLNGGHRILDEYWPVVLGFFGPLAA